MTRAELEHIIRASADITGQYEFIIVLTMDANDQRRLRTTIRRWAKVLREAGHDIDQG